MKRAGHALLFLILPAVIGVALFWLISVVSAAPPSSPCTQSGPSSAQCDPVNATNPLPTLRVAAATGGYTYTNSTGTGTTIIKSGAGTLHSICINTKGATANTLTVFDNTAASGTKIGTIDTTAAVGCLIYDVAFATGLTLSSASGTGADVTTSWK
jgi:hypothetical protein